MEFSIIYDFDCRVDDRPTNYNPPESQRKAKLWQLTERNEQFASHECVEEDIMPFGHHRKWIAILNKKQFEEFIEHTGLWPESCETGGSIGAPGYGFACVPAIAFMNYDSDALYQSAYVTPIPKPCRKNGWTERDFQRIKEALLRKYH